MKFIFFSLRDYRSDVGESVRAYGLLNALSGGGSDVVFISNACNVQMFHPNISHYRLGVSIKSKRLFQALLSLMPPALVYLVYKKKIDKISKLLKDLSLVNDKVYFLDYLDNSMGYLLSNLGFIRGNINDVHGIATLEFSNSNYSNKGLLSRIIGRAKLFLVSRLDRKVFDSAHGFLFGSWKMKHYYSSKYDISKTPSFVLPYLLSVESDRKEVNSDLLKMLKEKYRISDNDIVIFFAGTYKITSGVDDLIHVFARLSQNITNIKLMLIGGGVIKSECTDLVSQYKLTDSVIFINSVQYSDLLTYQSLSKIVVCPDKDNLYSHFVIHVKYFDALLSGKVVLNGAFDSIVEINANEDLSLLYKPSDQNEMYQKLLNAIVSYDNYISKYASVKRKVLEKYTYSSFVNSIRNWHIQYVS